MAKPKARTLQQRFGFMDKDLSTPKHDEMMLWLDENITTFLKLNKLIHFSSEWTQQNCGYSTPNEYKRCSADELDQLMRPIMQKTFERAAEQGWHYEHLDDEQKEIWDSVIESTRQAIAVFEMNSVPAIPAPKNWVDMIWESPVTSGKNNYIIGFIDIVVKIRYPQLEIDTLWQWNQNKVDVLRNLYQYSLPESAKTERLCLLWPHWKIEYQEWDRYSRDPTDKYLLNIEIKTKIPSLGELLRQIRMYQTHQGGKYIVVCPDDRFKEPLASQGITLIKYDPPAYTAARFEHGESG